jgi:hypothetical protein
VKIIGPKKPPKKPIPPTMAALNKTEDKSPFDDLVLVADQTTNQPIGCLFTSHIGRKE